METPEHEKWDYADGESPVPEWSCGGYVHEDALTPEFEYVDLPSPPGATSKITRYPVLKETPWVMPGDDTPLTTIRWLSPQECPVHGVPAPASPS